ncbi:MAG: carboxypeptidase-like regulatory domain-containing protein [candidate division Zixibacteria bacterium]|nr:carboxypeptidase-like regulatory domain-containing protein [candidate division Zixibacteria bacterium]
MQETDIVRKNALSEEQELFIIIAGGIAGAGVQLLTGIPAPFLGEGAKLLGFKLGEYLALRDVTSAAVEYPRIGRIEIVYVRSKNRMFVNAHLEEPVCKEVFILVPIELKPKKTPWGTYVCPPTWAGLTCPPEAAVKEIAPQLEDVKMMQSPRKDRACVTQSATQPTITSSLQITPKKDKYQVGDILTAEFTIANKGNAPIIFDVLTVGGRVNDICPQDKCPDFDWKRDFTLKPNEIYPYKGKLKLETAGDYHFFTAYSTKEGWKTAIPTAPGVTNTKDISVEATLIPSAKETKFKLSGFTKDQHGKPVENAAVWLVNPFTYREYGYSKTNQKGYFEIDIAPVSEGNYVLFIIVGKDTNHWYALKRTDLYEPYKKEIIITKKTKEEGIFLNTIILRKLYKISAKIIDISGSPVIGNPFCDYYEVVDKNGRKVESQLLSGDSIETSYIPDGEYTFRIRITQPCPFGKKTIIERKVNISTDDVNLREIVIPKEK